MAETTQQDKTAKQLRLLEQALDSGRLGPVKRLVNTLSPAKIGNLLESLPSAKRQIVWGLVDAEDDGEVLVHVGMTALSAGLGRPAATRVRTVVPRPAPAFAVSRAASTAAVASPRARGIATAERAGYRLTLTAGACDPVDSNLFNGETRPQLCELHRLPPAPTTDTASPSTQ